MVELILSKGGNEKPDDDEPTDSTVVVGVTCPLKSAAQAFPFPGPLDGQIQFQTVTAASNCRTDCALYRGSSVRGKPGECWGKTAAKAIASAAGFLDRLVKKGSPG